MFSKLLDLYNKGNYNELLKNLSGVQLPLKKTNYASNIYWVYGLVIEKSLNFQKII